MACLDGVCCEPLLLGFSNVLRRTLKSRLLKLNISEFRFASLQGISIVHEADEVTRRPDTSTGICLKLDLSLHISADFQFILGSVLLLQTNSE